MTCTVRVGGHCPSKPVEGDLLVGVVVLEDGSNAVDDLEVLILTGVHIVQRLRIIDRAI